MTFRYQHGWACLLLTAVVFALYAPARRSSFCSYDDFLEIRRAALEDARQPDHMLTTTHFGSYKYRPLNRAINLLTYEWGRGSAEAFRFRNFLFHSLNVALLYGIGVLLIGNTGAALCAALLFAVHPLASPSVMGAVITNTAAHACILATVFIVLLVAGGTIRATWLAASGVLVLLSLLTYESSVVVLGLGPLLLLLSPRGARAWRVLWWQLSVSVTAVALWLAVRMLFMPAIAKSSHIAGLGAMFRSAAMYGLGLVMPVDIVLLNEWFGVPMPSQIHLSPVIVAVAALASGAGLAGAVIAVGRVGARMSGDRLKVAGALAISIGLLLAPVVVFAEHPSETYLYLPVGFFALLVAHLAFPHVVGRRAALAACSTVALLMIAGTSIRNARIRECGATADRILKQAIAQIDASATDRVILASWPAGPEPARYSVYGFHGLDTIGDGVSASAAVTSALQWRSGNPRIAARVVQPRDLLRACGPLDEASPLCAWVYPDGRLERAQ